MGNRKKLLPCPLCKEVDILENDEGLELGEVGCTNCSCRAMYYDWMNRQPTANEELIAALEAGWSLSTWAACINWDGSRNEKEWLDELRLLIEDFQKKYEGATNA